MGADIEEKLSKGFRMGYDPLPQPTSVAEKLAPYRRAYVERLIGTIRRELSALSVPG